MTAKHTQGRLQAGVSKYQGVQHFTAVAENNEQKIVALCGHAGAADEQESIENAIRLAACWNAFAGVTTEAIEELGPLAGVMADPAQDLINELVAALNAAKKLFDEALPKFNWGASALDANAIRLLNEVPLVVQAAIASVEGGAA